MILKHSTSKFATKLKFKIYKPQQKLAIFFCVSTNTDINKLNWRFNHIFLVITNRNFYCKVTQPFENTKNRQKFVFLDFCLILIFNPRRTFCVEGQMISESAINRLLSNNGHFKFFRFHNKITKINKYGVLCFINLNTFFSKYSSLVASEDK